MRPGSASSVSRQERPSSAMSKRQRPVTASGKRPSSARGQRPGSAGGRCDSTTFALNHLSNDPGKVDSNFFCYAETVLSHIGMFSCLHRECINLHKGRLPNKMYLHSTLKGCFFVLKDFDQSQELKTIAKKSLQLYMFPT